MAACTALVTLPAVYAAETSLSPASWGAASCCVWLLYVLKARHMGPWDWRQLVWALTSTVLFLHFVLVQDPDFQGWADVYFFCGRDLRYCTCSFRWNLLGWSKAATLWCFLLTSALGLQKLLIQTGLGGLLPGEEIVTKESFISVCWRLIPYWLNNWEQQWGAECSSMLFELPHFAAELLVILPCVQILCARLKVLALPPAERVPDAGEGEEEGEEVPAEEQGVAAEGEGRGEGGRAAGTEERGLVPCFLTARWTMGPSQAELLPRLKANAWVVGLALALALLAAYNALVVPLRLEACISHSPYAGELLQGFQAGAFRNESAWPKLGQLDSFGGELSERVTGMLRAYEQQGCQDPRLLQGALRKHGRDLTRMQSSAHIELVPLVEVALAIMRLSCERYFVLVSVLAAYLLFRNAVPQAVRHVIRLNSIVSRTFQKVILMCFPAVCWAYGAGYIFSGFVSAVFWGHPAHCLWELLKRHATVVQPLGMRDATLEQVERMNAQCAVCWAAMGAPLVRAGMRLLGAGSMPLGLGAPPGPEAPLLSGKSLPCGHAFHEACIRRWLEQCHSQGRRATCPMCNAVIELEIKYRLPLPWRSAELEDLRLFPPEEEPLLNAPVAEAPPPAQEEVGDQLFVVPDLQALADPFHHVQLAPAPSQSAAVSSSSIAAAGGSGPSESATGGPLSSHLARSTSASDAISGEPDLEGALAVLAECREREAQALVEAEAELAAAGRRSRGAVMRNRDGSRIGQAQRALELARCETRSAEAHLAHEKSKNEVLRLRNEQARGCGLSNCRGVH